jgi:hypothetical protein
LPNCHYNFCLCKSTGSNSAEGGRSGTGSNGGHWWVWDLRLSTALYLFFVLVLIQKKKDELAFMVKKEFIHLYSHDNFLETYHNRLIQSIKDNEYEVIYKEEEKSYYVINNEYLTKIPNVPKLGDLDLQKIIDSKYVIS